MLNTEYFTYFVKTVKYTTSKTDKQLPVSALIHGHHQIFITRFKKLKIQDLDPFTIFISAYHILWR